MTLVSRGRRPNGKAEAATWQDVGAAEEFPPETTRTVTVLGTPIAVFHVEGRLSAIADVCPHMGASLSDGVLNSDGAVICPSHALSFDLHTGKCQEDGMYAARTFRVAVRDGRVLICV